MIFESLYESSQRGELLLVDGGFCHWHLRRDGQLTIREIISTKKGAGTQMLNRLKWTLGATHIFAKCPVGLPSINWYMKKGFRWDQMEYTRTGRKLAHLYLDVRRDVLPNANGIHVIYCANGNARFTEIAIDAGMIPGAQLPGTIYYQPYFADQDWKKPDRAKYMARLAQYKPYMATVLDWEREDQFNEVMSWADEASQHVSEVLIIPKIPGTVDRIPDCINSKPIRLAYSVPSQFGKSDVPIAEFGRRPVHLLGASPDAQLELAKCMNVKSADGNYIQAMAVRNLQYYAPGTKYGKSRNFPYLKESDGGWAGYDAPYEAFRRSSLKLMQMWRERNQVIIPTPPYTRYMFSEIGA